MSLSPAPAPAGARAFEEYHRGLAPHLDAAVADRVGGLLGGLPLAHREALRAGLTAGKKLRGTLLCFVAEALGGERGAALPRAVAVELVQAASLIHDDVVDGDRVRRGLPAAWALEGVRRAVLLGDLLFASTIAAMNDLGREDGSVISRAIARIAEGACREPLEPAALAAAVAAGRFPANAHERIARLKTGVLFGAACELGAVAARAGGDLAGRFRTFGLLLGEAYQIADDLEDLRELLAAGSAPPGRVAPLAPGLLGLAAETRPRVLALLRGEALSGADLRGLLDAATARFTEAIEDRLVAAAGALGDDLPSGPAAARLRGVPREVIHLFQEGESRRAGR